MEPPIVDGEDGRDPVGKRVALSEGPEVHHCQGSMPVVHVKKDGFRARRDLREELDGRRRQEGESKVVVRVVFIPLPIHS